MKNPFFRANAGGAIIKDGKVLAFERGDRPGTWQMPQGGIEYGENPLEAILREIKEETDIDSEDLRHVGTYPEWIAYELPEPKEKHGMGQVQQWHFFEFAGKEEDIKPQQPVFGDKQWMPLEELIDKTSPFRVKSYKKLLAWAKEQKLLP